MDRRPADLRTKTHANGRTISRAAALPWLGLCLLLAGCPAPQSGQDGASPERAAVGTIRLAVVDDPALAAAIEPFRGEWQGQTGGDFVVEPLAADRLADPSGIAADAILCAPHHLGTLAAGDRLAPLPEHLRKGDRSHWPETFSLLRAHEAVWGGEVLGVPFGSPALVCYLRADLLEELDRDPPETWAEYQELAALLADRGKLGDKAPAEDAPWSGTLEPLAPGWAGNVLLARAAAYATHRENYSTLFEIDTMKPLVAGPPFVRALEELVAAAAGAAEPLALDPAAVRKAFWAGRAGMALSWPSAAQSESIVAAEGVEAALADLPGAAEVYDVFDGEWEHRGKDEDPRVTLLGIAGRLGVVSRHSQWPEAAFGLLLWLSEDDRSLEVSAASGMTTLFRPSQIDEARAWVEPPLPPEGATRYGELVQTMLSRPQCLFAVRLPGREEYEAALDEAVRQAVGGEKTPEEALREAAARWDAITERLGRRQQAAAYYHSLGLR